MKKLFIASVCCYGSHKAYMFWDKPLINYSGIKLPGITSESQKLTLELLEKNHQSFDIFFNKQGFHNHLVHHVLAAYSCGATPELIRKIFERHARYQRSKSPPQVTITRENWTEHLGRNELWTDYLKFFDDIVSEEGIQKAFETYAFHPDMFPKLFSGAFHPVIHVGYGMEFQLPLILSEGLAQTAVHENRLNKLINDDLLSGTGTKQILDIINEVRKDKRFDNVLNRDDNGKLNKLLRERADVIREIAKSWAIPDTEEGVEKAAHELYDACALVYGATGISPNKDKIHLDFFLMHGLTSMFFVYTMLPFASVEKRRMLLRAHFAVIVSQYIARGRPNLNIEALNSYVPKQLKKDPNPWLDIISSSLLEDNEAHIIKVIRSLLKAEREWGHLRKDNIYLKIAQLTYEGFEQYGWREDIGFEED